MIMAMTTTISMSTALLVTIAMVMTTTSKVTCRVPPFSSSFQHVSYLFLDENECVKYEDLCDQNADCINTIGSYECVCKQGFRLNGEICEKGNYSIIPPYPLVRK